MLGSAAPDRRRVLWCGVVVNMGCKNIVARHGRAYLGRVIAQNEIRQMPLAEKLVLLEAVWAEISSEPEQVEVPQWHKDLLDERVRDLKAGSVKTLDWDEAKKQIEKAVR